MTDDLATTLRIDGDAAHFVVTTADPVGRERLLHMGWQAIGDGVFDRVLSARGDVARIHATFGRHLRQMVRQSARLEPVRWEIALEEFLGRVDGTGLHWWLYGSGALAVRGITVEPGDLDFAVDDAQHAGRIFEDLLVEPVTGPLDWVARWIGRAFHGALFEWSAEAVAEPPNEFGDWAARRLEVVEWRGRRIAVPRLEVQLEVARRRGLTGTVAAIEGAMRQGPGGAG
ncbi:hypothetical protein AB0M54_00115 [Actinoplanes sp. NPDC051470]|uniref:hypothetical protein n=1 Tax=unclassified Actinoplanes TaxID=2626549 RepID=UPI00342E844C